MKEVRLDLFKLHDENDKDTGRIKAVPNNRFLEQLRKVRLDVENKGFTGKEIAKTLKLHPDLFYRYFDGTRKIPLAFIKQLLNLWTSVDKTEDEPKNKETEIFESIEYLDFGTGIYYKRVKAPKYLNENLCFITGAIAADGSLDTLPKTKKYYVIRLCDQYKENVIKFCELIKQEFDLELIPRFSKRDNYWYVRFANKIIFRYLTNLFDFVPGKKVTTVKMPSIIKSSTLDYKISFVKGFMMFDGGIGYGIPKITLPTKSKVLFMDLLDVLKEMNLEPDYINDKMLHSKDTCAITFWKRGKLEKVLESIIERNSIKWWQLNYILNGGLNVDNFTKLDELISFLDNLYPPGRKSAMGYRKILRVMMKRKFLTLEDASIIFGRDPRVVHPLIKNLERWNVLNSKRSGLYKVWKINPNLKLS